PVFPLLHHLFSVLFPSQLFLVPPLLVHELQFVFLSASESPLSFHPLSAHIPFLRRQFRFHTLLDFHPSPIPSRLFPPDIGKRSGRSPHHNLILDLLAKHLICKFRAPIRRIRQMLLQ